MPANQYSQMENFGTELVEGTHANRMDHFPEIEQTKKGNDSLVSSSTSVFIKYWTRLHQHVVLKIETR